MAKRFSKEEHFATGVRIARLRKELMSLANETVSAYGKSSKVSRAAFKALEGLEPLRNLLDDELANETTQDEWTKEHLARAYYGAEERIEAATESEKSGASA